MSWFWRAVSAGTSKTPPELFGAVVELGKLLSHVAEHRKSHLTPASAGDLLCHEAARRLMGAREC